MFNSLDTSSPARSVYRRSDFLKANAERTKAKAGLDVEMAQQAVADSERASQRASSALAGSRGGAAVGGGVFSRLRGRRGGVVLGGAMTGGLAAANRAKLADAKRTAINTSYDADIKAMSGTGGGRAVAKRLRANKLIA
jgi:hypothetical protein